VVALVPGTCLAGEVELNGFDTDVLGAGSHDCGFLGAEREENGEEGESFGGGAYTAG
jgi:hypothetical protein